MSTLRKTFQPSEQHENSRKHTHGGQTYVALFFFFFILYIYHHATCSSLYHPRTIPFPASTLPLLIPSPLAYRCPFPGCGREFNVNSNMRRHWRNHSRNTPVRLPDTDIGRGGVYHHPRLDGIPHHALMSPPATNSSVSEGNSDDEAYSDEDMDGYPMDVDDRAQDDGVDAPGGPAPPTPSPMKGSAGSSSSSDVSVWSRSASPARVPASTAAYGHVHGTQLHRRVHASTNAQDQQGRHPNAPKSECIYRPSIAAYAISCTDSRVSTALRPAFTSNSSCTVRDRERERDRDRYHARPVGGRETRHGQVYPS